MNYVMLLPVPVERRASFFLCSLQRFYKTGGGTVIARFLEITGCLSDQGDGDTHYLSVCK